MPAVATAEQEMRWALRWSRTLLKLPPLTGRANGILGNGCEPMGMVGEEAPPGGPSYRNGEAGRSVLPSQLPQVVMLRSAAPADTAALLAVAVQTGLFEPAEAAALLGGVLAGLHAGRLGEGHAAQVWTDAAGAPRAWTYFAPDPHAGGVWNLWWIGAAPALPGRAWARRCLPTPSCARSRRAHACSSSRRARCPPSRAPAAFTASMDMRSAQRVLSGVNARASWGSQDKPRCVTEPALAADARMGPGHAVPGLRVRARENIDRGEIRAPRRALNPRPARP